LGTPTDLIEINPEQPSVEALERAAMVIRGGGVVAIPTDALYSLIADPFNLNAVGRVFSAKGREAHRSLPILVQDAVSAEELVSTLPVRFHPLARRYWPGPLTIIMPASARIPLRVTGMTGRLALRQSRSRVAQGLLEWLNQPLISTSANISSHPTCKTGIDVFGMMDGRIDLVLDGGFATGGGSTTIDITEPYWRVIKEGSISERELADALNGT
jgi:L-threonylcarbamoyladenylate synthase